jgi:glycosyltransferase involved in cell wall biosynthesis
MYDVSIIIATRNEENYIGGTLAHLRESMKEAKKQGVRAELILVDSSDDKTADIARKYTNNVYCLPSKGVSRTRNFGAEKSCGRILVFMDADTLVQKSTVADLFCTFKNKSAVSTISFVAPSGRTKLTASAKLFYTLDKMFIKACAFIPFLIWFYNRGDVIAIRRDTFNNIKGFNETLYMMEITDLLSHASKLGKINVLSSPVFESSRRLKQWGVVKSYRVWWQNYCDFYLLKRLHDSSYEVVR